MKRLPVPFIAVFALGCAVPEQANLMHLADMPPFEGGRALDDCQMTPEQQREAQGWEHRCVVVSQNEAGARIQSYAETLRAEGWTEGGAAGSAMWVLIPSDENCDQVYSLVASDYPRGSATTAESEIVIDFFLEQRLRCGDERAFP